MSEKVAAIWARVSTEDRQEPSLDSQVFDIKSWLESQGWTVPPERIITVHWTSKNILACPDMVKLLSWVRSHQVGAVGLLHLDRFACRMGQMGQILDVFREGKVEMLAKNSPIQGGLLGEAMAMVITISKAFQVERADEGSKDGLIKRATLRGLPTTGQAPYGYKWDKTCTRLLATTNWENRKLIINSFLEGQSLNGIKRELHQRAIKSPKGLEWWPEPTIWGILIDSVNHGEYRALRRESVEPKERRVLTSGQPSYGKSSSRRLTGTVLPNIIIENPIITREEQGLILHRLEQNKRNASRNSKHDFLLKGMVYYELDGKRYYARYVHENTWAYEYPFNGDLRINHPRPYLNGRRIEAAAEAEARRLLGDEDVLGNELDRGESIIKQSISNLESERHDLERRKNANTNAETQLLLDKNRYGNNISNEAFERALTRLMAERTLISERVKEVEVDLQKLEAKSTSLSGLKQLRVDLQNKLDSKEFADRRFVLEALGTKVTVTEDARVLIDFGIPKDIQPRKIALSSPLNACPQYSIVLLEHPLLTIR